MKGGEHEAQRQGRRGDRWGIGNRRGDGQAFRRRGRERGVLRSRRRPRPPHGDRTRGHSLAFVNGAAQQFGRLDILVNNAGIRKYEKVDEASAASWNEIIGVNLMSYVFCAKAAVPLMRRDQGRDRGGAIVNVASVRSVVSGGGNLQYDTTKAGIAGLTRALAADHSSEGIRVNAVGPGPIFTPFHERRIAAAGETVEQYNAQAARGTMLKRPGRAEEVAAAILFLASDDASYVTGALLFVDGGMTAL